MADEIKKKSILDLDSASSVSDSETDIWATIKYTKTAS